MISAEQAEARGFTVDRTCYPWFAYKGGRYAPTESVEIVTPAHNHTEPLERLASAGATDINLWRWESGDGWCAESDSTGSYIAGGDTPTEALAELCDQIPEGS